MTAFPRVASRLVACVASCIAGSLAAAASPAPSLLTASPPACSPSPASPPPGPTASYQQPADAGTLGFYVFVEETAPGSGAERLAIVNALAPTSAPLRLPLTGTVNQGFVRRSLQAPMEPEIAVMRSQPGGPPVLAIPVEVGGLPAIEFVDFRAGIPSGTTVLPLPGFDFRHDLLVDSSDESRLYVTNADGVLSLRVTQVELDPGASTFSVAGTVVLPPFTLVAAGATRLVLDPVTGQLVVPTGTGLAILTVAPQTPPVLTTNWTVIGYTPNTNIAIDPNPAPGQGNLLVGFSSATAVPGHAYLQFGAATLAPGTPVVVDPFGGTAVGNQSAYGLASGFHEIALTPTTGGTVATFLLDQTPQLTAVGAFGTLDLATGVTSSTSLPGSPHGNPDAARNANREPVVAFLRAGGVGGTDSIAALGVGVVAPRGTTAVSSPVLGVVSPSACDRPWAMEQLQGIPNQSVVHWTTRDAFGDAGTVSRLIAAATPTGVTVGAPITVPSSGAPTTLATPYVGSSLADTVAGIGYGIFASGFDEAGGTPGFSDALQAGGTTLTYATPLAKAPLPFATGFAPGGFVAPAIGFVVGALPASVGARRAVFNEIPALRGAQQPVVAYPGVDAAGQGQLNLVNPLGGLAPQQVTYPTSGLPIGRIVTEVLPF